MQLATVRVDTRQTPVTSCEVSAPATCGELVQGVIGGVDFLVNCPIDLFARAKVTPATIAGPRASVTIRRPAHFKKLLTAIQVLQAQKHLTLRGEIVVKSAIPRSKGMASSTAELSAAIGALCLANGYSLSRAAMSKVLAEVEPFDGIHWPGVVRHNHLTGKVLDAYGRPPPLRVLVVDSGGTFETARFDRDKARVLYRKSEAALVQAVSLVAAGVRSGDAVRVGRGASISAQISQEIYPKDIYSEMAGISSHYGGAGLVCAHSGTVLGILVGQDRQLEQRLVAELKRTFSTDQLVGSYNLIGGGLVVL